MIFKVKKTISLIVIGIILISSSALFASVQEDKKITAVGKSVINDGNSVTARDSAIADAMNNITIDAVSKLVSSETILNNFQILSDNIYSKSKAYIESYKILSENVESLEKDKKEEKFYTVNMEAYVSFLNITNDLIEIKILSKEKALPRFILLIAQKNIDSADYKYWWSSNALNYIESTVAENEITKRFAEHGLYPADKSRIIKLLQSNFTPINPNPSQTNPTPTNSDPTPNSDSPAPTSTTPIPTTPTPLEYGVDLSDPDALKITSPSDVDIIIIGKALVQNTGAIEGADMADMKSVLADVNARILDKSGNLIAFDSISEKAVHIDEVLGADEALTKAAFKLADKLYERVVSQWGDNEKEVLLINLNVSGLTKKTFLNFMKILKEDVRGVSVVTQKSYTSGGFAKFDINFKGTPASFVNEIKRLDSPDFTVEATSMSSESLQVVLKEKAPLALPIEKENEPLNEPPKTDKE